MESCFPVMLKIIFSSFPLYTFSIHGFRRLFLGEIVNVASTDVEATAVIKKNSCDQDRQQGCKSEVYKYVV